jgi:putative ATPase
MLHGGEDPLYIARRLVRMAAEDVGLADPGALSVALAGRDVFHFLGSPEGELALAEVAVYLAAAPKSNRVYRAWGAAQERAAATPNEPVPLHVRNAPTPLMRSLGYGKGYRYDPDEEGGVAPQSYLPPKVEGERFYVAGADGYEVALGKRLEWFAEMRRQAREREAGAAREPDGKGGVVEP